MIIQFNNSSLKKKYWRKDYQLKEKSEKDVN
jgi:hypothetical protein